ncbi:MAG: HDOD domain-containing protein [Candidatus Didemnitutus sp.]|nr:HDOD domain-containing protein [Candidatus Didemnitutus sp.]
MANVLLVDPNDVARKAMQGILARGGHRFAAANSIPEALAFLRRNARVDLVFAELRLKGDGGLALVRQLKADRLLGSLPVVIYTEHPDRDSVKRAIELHVQNFLIKPYHDDDIFKEIEKAAATPWRATHFEEEKAFCRLVGITPAALAGKLAALRDAVPLARAEAEKGAALRDHHMVAAAVQPLREQGEAAGAWGLVEVLNQLTDHTSAGQWLAVSADLAQIDFAAELIAHWLDPQRLCPDFIATEEPARGNPALERERRAWLAAPGEGRCPVVEWDQLLRETLALPGAPVIDSAAANFQMVANGHPSCINPLMDLVARDPGLTAQMLVAANRAHPSAEEFNRIEDARLAIGQLGEMRLQEEARRLVVIDSRTFSLEPALSWASYWTFQRAVARVAQLLCKELEFYSLEATARTAGQMHDLGLMLLSRLRPAGFQAVLEHARIHRQPLREVEKLFLGGTTPQLATAFAEQFGLSRRFKNVLRWIEHPSTASEDRPLVAIISLSRHLCLLNEVGTSGDPLPESMPALAETEEWTILREGLYPSFNFQKFEQKVHAHCEQLRAELSGHESGTVRELISASNTR